MSSVDRPQATVPSVWPMAALTALIPLVLVCGWNGMLSSLGHFQRDARPIAGPAQVVTFPLRSGVVYRVYWKPSSDARSQTCRLDPSRPEEVSEFRMGSWGSLAQAVSDQPDGVVFDGGPYRLADQVQLQLKDRDVLDTTVSCDDGPVLVEAVSQTVRVMSVVEVLAYLVLPTAIVAGGWLLWWRRRRRAVPSTSDGAPPPSSS